MMDRILLHAYQKAAAGAAHVAHLCPQSSTAVWKVKSVGFIPNAGAANDATDYVTLTPKVGATALATGRATSATGLTAATPVNFTLTATGSTLEVTQASPLKLDLAQAGSGKAVEVVWFVEFEVLR